MSEETNKDLMYQFYKPCFCEGNLDLLYQLCEPNVVEHSPLPGQEQGVEGLRQMFAMLRAAFPDLFYDIEHLVADGEMVAGYATITGTHQGNFMGIPPTGKSFKISTADFVRFVDGKATDHWGILDLAGMMQQLGLTPPQGMPQP